MTSDLVEWAVLMVFMYVFMRNLECFISEAASETMAAVVNSSDAMDGLGEADCEGDPGGACEATDAADLTEGCGLGEVAQVADWADPCDSVGACGEAVCAVADGGGWDFFELLEGFE